MKKHLMLLLAILPLAILAQQNYPATKLIDSRLYEAYGKSYIDMVAASDSFLIQRWIFYLDNAFFISNSPIRKGAKEDDVNDSYPSVTVNDLAHINILLLEKEQNLKHQYYTETIYKIKNTNKFLVYYSGRNFIEKLNEYLNAQKKH